MTDAKRVAEDARAELEVHPARELTLPIREQMWLALGPVEKSAKGVGLRGPAHQRRTELQAAAARRVLPLWNAEWGTAEPTELVDMALDVAHTGGDGIRRELRSKHDRFRVLLGNVHSVPRDRIHITYVGFAAADVALTALFDVELYNQTPPEIVLDSNLDAWDAGFYACGAFAGELPWVATSDRERRRQFWLDYIDTFAELASASTGS